MDKTEDQSPVNRLSALPVDVILHILSFLPSKLSVSTSALSRSWRYMWTHVPTIDFDTKAFPRRRRKLPFSEIVNNFLLLYKVQTLNTLSLSPPNLDYYEDEIETWLEIAVARNVRNVNVCLNQTYALPQIRHLITCKTLVNLSLSRCIANVPNGALCLPSLKKLRLCRVDIGECESLAHLISGCQVLQELIIQDVFNTASNSRCVYVSSPTIKRLTVDFPVINIQDAFNWSVCWEVKIDAPKLTYLKVDDCRGFGVSVLQMTPFSVEEADVRLRKFATNSDYVPSKIEFLDLLVNAKCLRLAGYIDITGSSNVRFDNLTKLELDLTVDCPSFVKLLDSADNLQVLIVDLNLASWEDPKRVPKCLSFHLRTIRTGSIVCGEHEFHMLIYLARNAKVLEMMDLRSANCTKAYFDVIRRILWFKRDLDVCVLAMESEW